MGTNTSNNNANQVKNNFSTNPSKPNPVQKNPNLVTSFAESNKKVIDPNEKPFTDGSLLLDSLLGGDGNIDRPEPVNNSSANLRNTVNFTNSNSSSKIEKLNSNQNVPNVSSKN